MINRRLLNIIVQDNKESMDALISQFDDKPEFERHYETLPMDRLDYSELDSFGLFDSINKEFSICIDEYEEASICGNKMLQEFSNWLKEQYHDVENPIAKVYIKKIVNLTNYALEMGTGLFFYF